MVHMTTYYGGKVEALPKWARALVSRLEKDLASAHEKLNAGPADSNVFADPHHAAPRPLGRNTLVRYQGDSDVTFDVKFDGKGLVVTAFGGGDMVIRPVVSNVVHVSVLQVDQLPEEPCHRTREHAAHGNYAPGSSVRVSLCPGVVTPGPVEIAHPMDNDPFAGLNDEECL